ncbi:MAG TPA: FHA domain-containing protein [Planctomycetaceae bacterium]|jgi:predicted component of type VI protein secretion system|nr:FHA domain-containing protein [Planctomycetaceae bacterium]
MTRITIQVLEGFERGRVFADLVTPVTIGREEDNTIQLNDERVSRFHVKIQEDGGRVILTDLDSTNGTRINGHPVQVRVLQHGDQMSIGRSLLLFGSDREIQDSLRRASSGNLPSTDTPDADDAASSHRRTVTSGTGEFVDPSDFEEKPAGHDSRQDLFPQGAPELPHDLRIAQRAQVSDVLAFIHDQLALIADQAVEDRAGANAEMRVDWTTWQRLLRLEMQLANYLRHISDPHV